MKYKPEPIRLTYDEDDSVGWEIEIEEDTGYSKYQFSNQDDAMMFCLLLEIRDLLKTKI